MAVSYYLPSTDEERSNWLKNFSAKLPQYADKYGVDAEETETIGDMAQWFAAILDYQRQFTSFVSTVTAYKNALRNGLDKGATLNVLQVPTPPLPKMPAQPGIFEYVASVVNTIKSARNYSVADGKDLGIEGAAVVLPDPATLVPELKVAKGNGGHPELKWGKQQMPQLEICVDRGEGRGWESLVTSSQSRYLDQYELPAAGKSALWQYKAIYRKKDAPIGQWCDPVPTTVMG